MPIIHDLIADQWGCHVGKYSERLKITKQKEVLAQAPLLHLESVTISSSGVSISAEQAADPVKLAEFQKAQGELSGALSRLLVVSENYPDLKSNQNFLELQAQLEGTENRITVARNRYIQSVQAYNVHIRQFPVNLTAKMFGYDVKPNFTVENEAAISKPPTVEFAPANPPPSN